jgi:UDP-N-acetylglucosamine:LPS N-acetylglucosamine transferase
MACGLPMFIMQVIPGEEMGHAQLVVGGGAGDIALEPLDLLEGMAHWLADNGRLYHERAANARRLGNPRAAYDAADLIWDLAESGTDRQPSRVSKSVENIREILRQFGPLTTD